MLIYKDLVSGDELFTDSCGDRIRRNGLLYEVDCLYAKESLGIDESKIGANASAEEAEEGVEDASVQGLDVIIQNRLQKGAPHDKKTYAVHMKEYMKVLKKSMAENGKSDEEMKKWQDDATETVKQLLKIVKKCEIYLGESEDVDAMNIMLNYRQDGDKEVPYLIFWADGIVEEKA